MPLSQLSLRFVAVLMLMVLAFAGPALGATGDPVAIRHRPGGNVRVESHWGLAIVIAPSGKANVSKENGAVRHVAIGTVVDHTLSRQANAPLATWAASEGASDLSTDPNAMMVKSVGDHAVSIRLDGATVLVVGQGFDFENSSQLFEEGRSFDAVVLNTPAVKTMNVKQVSKWVQESHARFLVLSSKETETLARSISESVRVSSSVEMVEHDTLAISGSESRSDSVKIVGLSDSPVQLSNELESLMVRMETSCERSQKVFASLSARQLNFKPANGTHTPRWNAEHMMGRQLLFFSQIYHSLSPQIPVMDLNPKQMPPDYVAAHPEWDGAEEARQMQRVSEFTRRYCYLIQDIDLDRGAPGSRWTLRGLLRQMERHYDDHTGNTEKKFLQPGWPKE